MVSMLSGKEGVSADGTDYVVIQEFRQEEYAWKRVLTGIFTPPLSVKYWHITSFYHNDCKFNCFTVYTCKYMIHNDIVGASLAGLLLY